MIDYIKLHVKAGDGGRGCVAWRRENSIPMAVLSAVTAARAATSISVSTQMKQL